MGNMQKNVPPQKDADKKNMQDCPTPLEVKQVGDLTCGQPPEKSQDTLSNKRPGGGVKKDLIVLVGLPGSGKTTVAKKIVEKTQAELIDFDSIKKDVVPKDVATKHIEKGEPFPLKYRTGIHRRARKKLSAAFRESPTQTVVADETFHLRDLRRKMSQEGKALGANVHFVEVVCGDETVLRDRLLKGKDRESHILGDKSLRMHEGFKKVWEPLTEPHTIVDTSRELAPQIEKLVEKLSRGGSNKV